MKKIGRPKAAALILEDRLVPHTFEVQLISNSFKRNTVLCAAQDSGLCYLPITLINDISTLNRSHDKQEFYFYITPDGSSGETLCAQNTARVKLHCIVPTIHLRTKAEMKTIRETHNSYIICLQASLGLELLTENLIDLSEVKLIVFDECHEALSPGSMYCKIMDIVGTSSSPRIFGATASVVCGNLDEPNLLQNNIQRLKEVFNCTVELASKLMSTDLPVANPQERIELFSNCLSESKSEPDVAWGTEIRVNGPEDPDICIELEIEERAEKLTEKVHNILEEVYHFIGDMRITKEDVDYAERLFSKQSKSEADSTSALGSISPPSATTPLNTESDDTDAMHYLNACKDIPRKVCREVELTLKELGVWCAGCIAKNLSSTVDKIADKTRRKMDKLLLNLVSSNLKNIHRIVNDEMDSIQDGTDLLAFATPKLQAVIRILRSYTPTIDFEFTIASSSQKEASVSQAGQPQTSPKQDRTGWDKRSVSEMSDLSDLSEGVLERKDQESFTIARLRNKLPESKGVKLVSVNQQETTVTGLVYVERKHAAFAIHQFIEEMCVWDVDLYFVRSSYLIGCMNGTETKKQEDILSQFRQHKVNVLVISLQEFPQYKTLNLPKCNMVTMFDLPLSYEVYSNTKSRAKALKAFYILICDENAQQSLYNSLRSYHQVQSIFSQPGTDTSSVDKLQTPTEHAVELNEAHEVGEYSYTIPSTRATVVLNNAFPILNRYCSKLPSDIYTRLAPTYTVDEKTKDGFVQVSITLPVGSPVWKPIKGPREKTKKRALQAAAVEVCKQLHQKGELDDDFVPVGKKLLNDTKSDRAWNEESKLVQDFNSLPGSRKRQQRYNKKVAEILRAPLQPDTPCYLYAINIRVGTLLDKNKLGACLPLFSTKQQHEIGVVVANPLPQLVEFPIYTRTAEEWVKIKLVSQITLSQAQLNALYEFHQFLHENILKLQKFCINYDPAAALVQMYVGATIVKRVEPELDWEYMASMLSKNAAWKEGAERKRPYRNNEDFVFKFNREDFIDAVLTPSYRYPDQTEYFYVSQIRSDLNPKSPFPSPDYKDFHTYYTSKYGLKITNLSQNLLSVNHTYIRLNLLTPRYLNTQGDLLPLGKSDLVRQKKTIMRERQILVPELCDIHPCPTSLWLKVVCLPSILYRIHSLLLAHELLMALNEPIHVEHQEKTDEILDLGVDLDALHLSDPLSATKSPPRPPLAEKASQSKNVVEESDHFIGDYMTDEGSRVTPAKELNDSLDGDDIDEFNTPFDYEDSDRLIGPSLTMMLQAITMLNSGDFINLERLETVGDSYLKFSTTLSLFMKHPHHNEGRLSHARTKQVSNFILYRHGRGISLQEYLLSGKFDPQENWLPPGYSVKNSVQFGVFQTDDSPPAAPESPPPMNMCVEHCVADKSIADSVESLIGAYLIAGGQRTAQTLMRHLGIEVLDPRTFPNHTPKLRKSDSQIDLEAASLADFEKSINYTFKNKHYLVQAFTHRSYTHNLLTDCFQRLEFLGDAVLDYIITRQLYEDQRMYSPGVLTDLRSALVNNNVFAALAVKWGFHKFIKLTSIQIVDLINKFVRYQEARQHCINMEGLLRVGSQGDADEIEVPKILGDIFESVAGAVFLDSEMSLETLWKVYRPLMRQLLVKFSLETPLSPVRELLELHPVNAKFQPPERKCDGTVRVCVTIAGHEPWVGEGRTYRIAKTIAAKKALKDLRPKA